MIRTDRIRHFAFAILALLTITVSGAMAYVQTHGGHFLSIQTGSMVPNFKKGDVVAVTRIPASQLRVGDVITFINPRNQKQTITHRLVKVPTGKGMDQSFQTKGDANNAADMPISSGAILGKARGHVPFVGFVLDFMRTPIGLALLVYLPALVVIIKELQRLAAYYKSQEPYVLPSRTFHLRRPEQPRSAVAPKLMAGVGALIAAGLLAVAPAYAALSSSAVLTGNSVSTVTIGIADHILIRRLDLRCGRDHTAGASQRPVITLYNPTNNPIAMGSWHIDDNSGRIVTLPAGTVLQGRHQYVITPLLRTTGQYGIQFAGDRLALLDAHGVPVDGFSWGSDNSQLPQPLPALSLGTSIRRAPPRQDTNTAADFRIVQNQCTPNNPIEQNLAPSTPGTFTIQETGDSE